jgi:predicted TIM-barrel fold metal-dependent hydrolase
MNQTIDKTSNCLLKVVILLTACLTPLGSLAAEFPVIDAHIHYSHDAWEVVPPEKAVAILREAGLKKAFVSSSSDEGTQKLFAIAPDLVVPVLRPYRKRGETSSWKYDETIIVMLGELLGRNRYAGIGEFHASGEDIELPVLQKVIGLAKQYGIFLHAHVDSEAIQRIFKHNPDALVLWAHAGFDDPDEIRAMLEKYPNLWSDLAFRSEQASQGQVVPGWRELFIDFPDRFVLGTDTYTPDRWFDVVGNAEWSREWLKSLPQALAKNIAYRNAETLLKKAGFE